MVPSLGPSTSAMALRAFVVLGNTAAGAVGARKLHSIVLEVATHPKMLLVGELIHARIDRVVHVVALVLVRLTA